MPFLLFSKFLQKVKNDFVLFLMELHTSKTLNVILNETRFWQIFIDPLFMMHKDTVIQKKKNGRYYGLPTEDPKLMRSMSNQTCFSNSPVAILGLVVFRSQLTHVFIHFSSLLTLLLQTISCCSIYAECFQRFMHQNGIA